jgi:DNA polymerase III delta prime subunit
METTSHQKTIRRHNSAVGNTKNVVRAQGNYEYEKQCYSAPNDIPGSIQRYNFAVGNPQNIVRTQGNYEYVKECCNELENLIGLKCVKARIREIAGQLIINRFRRILHSNKKSTDGSLHHLPINEDSSNLHQENIHVNMLFTGNRGVGKTSVAKVMASLLYKLGYTQRESLIAVSRENLVGKYVGHTIVKVKEVIQSALGGVLFIREIYDICRLEVAQDYGREIINILLSVMENGNREIVFIFAGCKERMTGFLKSNAGFSARLSYRVDFPDYTITELVEIFELECARFHYALTKMAKVGLVSRLAVERMLPDFANLSTICNLFAEVRRGFLINRFRDHLRPSYSESNFIPVMTRDSLSGHPSSSAMTMDRSKETSRKHAPSLTQESRYLESDKLDSRGTVQVPHKAEMLYKRLVWSGFQHTGGKYLLDICKLDLTRLRLTDIFLDTHPEINNVDTTEQCI